jgi:hypothetical protein
MVAEGHWTAARCAKHIGRTVQSWAALVAHGNAPQPVTEHNGERLWSATEVERWWAEHPKD